MPKTGPDVSDVGSMNVLISWLLIISALTGILTGGEEIRFESHGTSVQLTATPVQTHHDSAPPADCDHEGSPCHTCHLGHCAFPVSLASATLGSLAIDSPPLMYFGFLPSDYISNLFRPPIA